MGALYLDFNSNQRGGRVKGQMTTFSLLWEQFGAMSAEAQEKRFVRLSPESVRNCAENLGIQVSPDVSSALVEDVSFRIRQVTDVSYNTTVPPI